MFGLRTRLAIVGVAVVFIGLGLYHELRGSSPPPSPPNGVPNGVWTSPGNGRLETAGGKIETALIPVGKQLLRSPLAIDLGSSKRGEPSHVDLAPGIWLDVVWRDATIRMDGLDGKRAVHVTFRRTG